jgi:hypothetical protein
MCANNEWGTECFASVFSYGPDASKLSNINKAKQPSKPIVWK